MELFDKAMNFIGLMEGGYVNDPIDKGGETKYGISKRSYPNLDIKNLTKEQAREIYYKDFWLKNKCDTMHPVFSVLVFDTAVNMGSGVINEFLKSSDYINPERFLLARIKKYIKYCLANPTQQRFFFGWIVRCMKLYDFIKTL